MQAKNVYNIFVDKTILHCDLNNFYASVEQKLHPEFDGLPLAVCGDPKLRHGIVLAKNQLAKKAGVKTGEAIWLSKRKCPNIVFVTPHYDEYVKYSKQVFNIYLNYTDLVESFGIDECWLDVTASQKLFGDGKIIADELRARVKRETGLTISVGVSFTKTLAKLGSDLKKPDATTVLMREDYLAKIGDMSPSELIMIGDRTMKKLSDLNVHTIRDLANADVKMLEDHFGIIAKNMVNAARGVGDDEVKRFDAVRIPKSVSNGTTTPRNIEDLEEAKIVIYSLSELVANRLRSYNLVAEGVALSIKNPALNWKSKQTPLVEPSSNATDIAEAAIKLLTEIHSFNEPLRAVTVAAIRLSDSSHFQLSLFSAGIEKENKLEKSVDSLRSKYGYNVLKRGITLENDLTLNLHEDDDFRPFHQSKTT